MGRGGARPSALVDLLKHFSAPLGDVDDLAPGHVSNWVVTEAGILYPRLSAKAATAIPSTWCSSTPEPAPAASSSPSVVPSTARV